MCVCVNVKLRRVWVTTVAVDKQINIYYYESVTVFSTYFIQHAKQERHIIEGVS